MHRQGHTNKDGQYPNTLNAVCNLCVGKKITFNFFLGCVLFALTFFMLRKQQTELK